MAGVSPLQPDDLNARQSLQPPAKPGPRGSNAKPAAREQRPPDSYEDRVDLSAEARQRVARGGSVVSQLNKLIHAYDLDHDGKLSASELGMSTIQIESGGNTQPATIPVTTSGAPARLVYTLTAGSAISGDVYFRVAGLGATDTLAFAGGTSLSSVAGSINTLTSLTGISANVNRANLILNSVATGSRAFVSVEVLSGNLVGQAAGTVRQDNGEDGRLLPSVDLNADGELSRAELLNAYRQRINSPNAPDIAKTA